MPKKKQTLGAFIFDYLYKRQGVKHAFGIPGDFALPTFRWLDQSKIKLITMTHEPSVGFAADAYARINGLGVACVTYCVGGLNMVNSVACAYAEKSPVVVISGGPSTEDRKEDQLIHHKVKTFDTQRHIYEEITCATALLDDIETAADEIIRVVEMALFHCRPVYIEIPCDMVDKEIAPPSKISQTPIIQEDDAEELEECLRETVEMISKAKRPVIIADVELHRHGLTDLAVEIAEKLNIPIAATMLSKSLIRETNPLYLGVYSGGLSDSVCQSYVESSDCIVMLGAFVSDVFLGWYTAHMERKNTILVTIEKIRVGLHGYDKVSFNAFLEGIHNAKIPAKKAFKNLNKPKKLKPLQKKEQAMELSAEGIFRILGLHMTKDSALVCDTGDSLVGSISLRTMQRKTFISDAYYLSMGFAVPASIGAMITKSHEKTFVIVGDGAFQMTGVELSTAAKYGLKPIVIIINNDGYGTQRNIIDGSFNDIHMWNYTKICDMLGYGKSVRATTFGEMESALQEAISSDEMMVIEAVIPRDDCSDSLRRLGTALSKLRDVEKQKITDL